MADEARAAGHPVFAYIDCLRGYAILLVITCHLTFSYPELPYPVHRLTVLGWLAVTAATCAGALPLSRHRTPFAPSAAVRLRVRAGRARERWGLAMRKSMRIICVDR